MNWLSDDSMKHLRSVVDLPDLSQTHYRLGERIASGGMATIYKAEDTRLNRTVAVKVLSSTNCTDEFIARMSQEAKVIASLEHPGIVPIHDFGRLPDGRVFYVMKYVEGKTLESFVESEPSLTARLRVFQKVVEAVSFAHSRQIIHRDLKPANIMVGAYGEVLVMDWGIAAQLESKSRSPIRKVVDFVLEQTSKQEGEEIDTAHGTLLGTPAFMSPEQARGESEMIGQRSDIYSLGAVLYFLLTGRPPFQGTSAQEIAERAAAGELIPPREVDRSIQKQIEAVCLKAMAVEPDARYQTSTELSADVTSYLDGSPVSAYRENLFERSNRWIARNQFIMILIVAYILVRFLILILLGH